MTTSLAGQAGALLTQTVVSPATTAQTWIDQNIHDPTIHLLVRGYEADNTLSRADMIAIFQTVSADAFQSGGISSTQLADLQALVNNPTILGMPDYVHDLANKVVNFDPADANYQGSQLEYGPTGLRVGDSGQLLTNLTNKWFLGTDHPALPNLDYNNTNTPIPLHYQLAAGTLFGSGVQYSDVMQGGIGDCYMMSALEETAVQAPSIITSMFIDNGDGTYTVRFYNNGTPDYVTVDRYLPADANGKFVAANQYQSFTDPSDKLWVALAEKAYAQLDASGWNRDDASKQVNTYDSLNGGDPGVAMAQVTGHPYFSPTSDHGFPPTTASLISDFQNGRLILLKTSSDAKQVAANIVPNHIYAMISYINSSGGLLVLDNPWAFNPSDQTKSQTVINTLDNLYKLGFIGWAEVSVKPSPMSPTPPISMPTGGKATSAAEGAPMFEAGLTLPGTPSLGLTMLHTAHAADASFDNHSLAFNFADKMARFSDPTNVAARAIESIFAGNDVDLLGGWDVIGDRERGE